MTTINNTEISYYVNYFSTIRSQTTSTIAIFLENVGFVTEYLQIFKSGTCHNGELWTCTVSTCDNNAEMCVAFIVGRSLPLRQRALCAKGKQFCLFEWRSVRSWRSNGHFQHLRVNTKENVVYWNYRNVNNESDWSCSVEHCQKILF